MRSCPDFAKREKWRGLGMKAVKQKPDRKVHLAKLKNPRRRSNCAHSQSLKLPGDKEPPGDRGACEPESTTQGSE
jgi:hypothetical protein